MPEMAIKISFSNLLEYHIKTIECWFRGDWIRPHYKDMPQEKGITLVALIITIIVLIILAGVNILNNNTVIPVLLRISTTKLLPFCYPPNKS